MARIGYICGVESADINRRQLATVVEHKAHALNLRCVKLRDV